MQTLVDVVDVESGDLQWSGHPKRPFCPDPSVTLQVIVVASRVSYLLLRCAPQHGGFGLSLRSYQFAVSTPFGVHPSVQPRSPPPGEYACVPSFPSRQESAGKSRAPPPQTPPSAPVQASDFRSPLLARPAKQISYFLHEKRAILRGSTLPPPPGSVQSCESLVRSSGDSVDYGVCDHHRTAYVYCSRPNHRQTLPS